MRDSLLEDQKLTTADIARLATPRQARAEAARRGLEPVDRSGDLRAIDTDDTAPIALPASTPAANNSINDAGPLFPEDELHNYRARWDQVQTSFVDEPREAVEQADSLVANVVKRIAEQFANERGKLEGQWASGDDVNTEALRQALKRYRAFFDRLLSF
jgi:hypothetical protein